MTPSLKDIDSSSLPAAADPTRAQNAVADWQSKIAELSAEHKDLSEAATGPLAEALLTAICGNSPYLTQSIFKEPLFFARMLDEPLDHMRSEIEESLSSLIETPPTVAELKKALRIEKRRMALLTAVADISGLWSLEEVTECLSDFAAAATQAAVTHLLAGSFESGDLVPNEPAEDLAGKVENSGYIILAMGKMGARELNYSSDIDLIVLYDAEAVTYAGRRTLPDHFLRMTQELVKILHERTAEGYVFRVDLRLRPDAGATPLALNVDTAELYYQSTGLNWERAAMIKARPVAGDITAGRDFLDRIKAFVWRKHLDYAAVQDVQDIKHKIHSHHRHRGISVAGQDIKLGYGGIREIEFFAQIYQLIMGGREYDLRVPQTLGALKALAGLDLVSQEEAITLSDAYRFLRRLEHRVQMVNDEQTHELPEDDAALRRVALFMGYDGIDALAADLIPILENVHKIYDALAEETGTDGGDTADEASSWASFKDADKARAILDGWLEGRHRACRTQRARTILKGLVPDIVAALSHAPDPDTAVVRLDEFLAKLPSGVQLFSLFQANPWLLDLVVEIMAGAPALAAELSRNVHLLDAVLSPDFFDRLPDEDVLRAELDEQLARARDYEDVLDLTRRFANERRFQVGVQMLRQVIDANEAGLELTRLAEICMQALYPRVLAEFEQHHGKINGEMAVLGLGKLGAQELTFQSDLDLIFLFESDEEPSDGPRSLPVSQYFARLGQRYINAISALTAEGRLFEVDMRLRPSGHAGPIAIALDAFLGYQKTAAWTWEHMAMTKARTIVASPDLRARVDSAVSEILQAPRNPDNLLKHVADMRRRLDGEFGTKDMWSVKYVRGGLIDIEFIIQYLILKTAHERKQVLSPHLGIALESLQAADVIDKGHAEFLGKSLALQQNVQSFLRLCCTGRFEEETAGRMLTSGLARFCGADDFAALKDNLQNIQAETSAVYDELIEGPARRLPMENEDDYDNETK